MKKNLIIILLLALINGGNAFAQEDFWDLDSAMEPENVSATNTATAEPIAPPADTDSDIKNVEIGEAAAATTDDLIDSADTANIAPPPTEQDDVLNIYMEELSNAEKARKEAERILDSGFENVMLRDSQKKLIRQGDEKRRQMKQHLPLNQESDKQISSSSDETEQEKPVEDSKIENQKSEPDQNKEIISQPNSQTARPKEPVKPKDSDTATFAATEYTSAPFGLFWNIPKEQLEAKGFSLHEAQREGYENVYSIDNAQQKNQTFTLVTAIFGKQNHLWCIYAQSAPQEDTPQLEKTLALYHTYYEALKHKYGNDQEHFSPYTYTVETDADNQPIIKENPIGGDNFRQEIKEEKAELYATFSDGTIGATLILGVTPDNLGYIALDYKNLPLKKSEDETDFNNLIEDL